MRSPGTGAAKCWQPGNSGTYTHGGIFAVSVNANARRILETSMKLTVTRKIERREVIEIGLPYYYKHDLMLDDMDSVIYGKVEEMRHTTIRVQNNYRGGMVFELEVETRGAASVGCYMTDEYKSNEAEYVVAKAKLLAAAKDA